jgi:hypothetical protein
LEFSKKPSEPSHWALCEGPGVISYGHYPTDFLLGGFVNTPDQTVRAFIGAYHVWNSRANERSKVARGKASAEQEAMAAASAEYGELVSQLCAASVIPQGISFGDDPMHHPDHEAIESVTISEREATVRTRHMGLYDFISVYEYRMVQEDGEWRIASLLYIDDEDGRYECL